MKVLSAMIKQMTDKQITQLKAMLTETCDLHRGSAAYAERIRDLCTLENGQLLRLILMFAEISAGIAVQLRQAGVTMGKSHVRS
jgi:hypothetical protein